MRYLFVVAMMSLPSVVHSAPQPWDIGAGFMLGEPSGLSFKLFVDDNHAFDGGLSFSFKDDTFHGHADYLLHFPGKGGGNDTGAWVPYAGVGAKIQFLDKDRKHSNDGLAARVPIGVVFHPSEFSVDFFVEVVAGMQILPETNPEFGGAIGGRFYF
jgi:hypothetical protein